MRELELLIPARNADTGMAAVDHGADAVYIGGPAFGARGAAGNTVGDIARLVDYARPYGVKIYAAVNTLIYEDELIEAERVARELVSAGVDALIVQDTALLMMGIEGVAFHASTQMCNTNPEHVRFLARSGFSRVVLERGLTLAEIKDITQSCGVETECFVHGAICVGHSGRCYLSRSMGPRSGNRGVCGQPCRIKYDLEDRAGNVLIKDKHLLSVKDLNLSGYLGRMIDAGVTSFKVEGRLKETEYVKNITAFYRERLDAEIAKRQDVRRSSDGVSAYSFTPDPAKSFSRGFTVWTADGAKAGSASFDTPKSLGEPLGAVADVKKDCFTLVGRASVLSAGDGICFIERGGLAGTNINRVEGGWIYPNRMDGIRVGTELFRNLDHRFNTSLGNSRTRRAIPLRVGYVFANDTLEASATDPAGNSATLTLKCEWGRAENPERMAGVIESQFSKSGGTIFDVVSVNRNTPGDIPFVPVSELNRIRRELLEKLVTVRIGAFEKNKAAKLGAIQRDDEYPYPAVTLGGEGNVTNSLARRFWRMHGVVEIGQPFDLRDSLDGETVMVTPYCILRETGRCPKQTGKPADKNLYLNSGNYRYRLVFDCKKCRMSLEKCPANG